MSTAQRLVDLLLEGESPKEFLLRVGKPFPSIDEVTFKIYMEPDNYYEIDGSFTEPDNVAWVKKELEDGNAWAWCCVEVRASWWNRKTGQTYKGSDYLGGCSYRSEADFKQPGYYDDMKKIAYDELVSNIDAGHEDAEY